MTTADRIAVLQARLTAEGTPFVLATVVRTVAATAAKAGAKALVLADGELHGFVGGGCVTGAVRRAAAACLAEGRPRLISVVPEAAFESESGRDGPTRAGRELHRSMCPSGGTLDIFLEPVLPRPELVVVGASPVAVAVADLGARLGFRVVAVADKADAGPFPSAAAVAHGIDVLPERGDRWVVVATQGKGDVAALRAALGRDLAHLAFVGSRRKWETLAARLAGEGAPPERLARVRSPAGLDIGAILPEEIALSILAEIVGLRRGRARAGPASSTRDGSGTGSGPRSGGYTESG
jgi:xanthine dehydrogenase accessory factor